MPFSNKKLLLLLFNFCSLETLILNLRTAILLLEAIIQSKQKVHLGTIHQNKRKTLKSILKDKARCYGYESARNTENGAKTAILWDKRCFRDLVAINYGHEGLAKRICEAH